MILAVNIRDNAVFLAARGAQDESPRFFQFDIGMDILGEGIDASSIWNYADDSIKKIYSDAEKIVLGIPAPICFAKRLELDARLYKEKADYRRWQAAVQLPGNPCDYEFGFIPLTNSFNGAKKETVFFAAPLGKIEKLTYAVLLDKAPDSVMKVPEQIALVELLVKSISKDDISQAAIVHVEKSYIVAIVIKDARFYRGRVFLTPTADEGEFVSDIQTFLMSIASADEPLPLLITGRTEEFRIEWSPVIPAFLNIKELDFGISWGLLEFVLTGGRCELSAES